jgi:hypothetical protein
VGDVTGGLERANGGAALEAGLEASQRRTVSPLGLGRGGDVAEGQPVSETPGRRPRVNQRCSMTPLSEATDEVGRWAGSLTRLAGGPTRGSLAHLSFVDLFI